MKTMESQKMELEMTGGSCLKDLKSPASITDQKGR